MQMTWLLAMACLDLVCLHFISLVFLLIKLSTTPKCKSDIDSTHTDSCSAAWFMQLMELEWQMFKILCMNTSSQIATVCWVCGSVLVNTLIWSTYNCDLQLNLTPTSSWWHTAPPLQCCSDRHWDIAPDLANIGKCLIAASCGVWRGVWSWLSMPWFEGNLLNKANGITWKDLFTRSQLTRNYTVCVAASENPSYDEFLIIGILTHQVFRISWTWKSFFFSQAN